VTLVTTFLIFTATIILARVDLTLINLLLTCSAGEANGTVTEKRIDVVLACSAVLAWIGSALIYVIFTVLTIIAKVAETLETIEKIFTVAKLAGVFLAVIDVP